MKIRSRIRPSVEPIPGETQTHWQDNPLIAVVFSVMRMNENVQKAYFDIGVTPIHLLGLMGEDQIQRANYRNQYE